MEIAWRFPADLSTPEPIAHVRPGGPRLPGRFTRIDWREPSPWSVAKAAQSDHTQSRISGWSSRCSCAYATDASICASHSAISAGARSLRRGTRLIASAAKWNRLIELSTTIWNGVVVVPCSLKPRTWTRSAFGCPCTISWMARW